MGGCELGGSFWPDELCPLALVVPGGRSPPSPSAAVVALWQGAQKSDCHKGEGEKEAPRADNTAYRSFCVSARVPGFCLCLTPAVPGLSPGANGQEAVVEKRPCELEATAVLLVEGRSREKAGGLLCRWSQERSPEPGLTWEGRAAASKLPCWGWALAPASLEAHGPLQTLEPFPLLCSEMALNPGFNLDFFWYRLQRVGGCCRTFPCYLLLHCAQFPPLPRTNSGIICRKLCKSGEAICL